MKQNRIHRSRRIPSLAPVFFLALLLAAFLGGCSGREALEHVPERQERNFQRGKQLLREGREQEALSAFLSVIDKRRGVAPESHLEAGELFRTHLRDPISSIYHYRKFLEFSSDSPQAPHVHQLIETATKDFAANLPAHPLQSQHERVSLLETVERLREENEQWKRAVALAREERDRLREQLVLAASNPSGIQLDLEPESAAAQRETGNIYTVVPGDTLSHISGKVYGTTSRVDDIFEANRAIMANKNSLSVGMRLRLPE